MQSKTKKTLKSTSFFISLLLQLCFANEKDLNKTASVLKVTTPVVKPKNSSIIKRTQHQ